MKKSNKKVFKVANLNPATYNPRTISDEALKGLTSSLNKFGYIQDLVVNVRGKKNTIIAGHQRLKALKLQDNDEIECIVVDFDPIKEKAANVALNSETISGDWEIEGLETLLEELQAEYPDFDEVNLDNLAESIGITDFDGVEVDAKNEWEGMPEYEHEDKTSCRQLIVHFACEEDLHKFSNLIEQKITEKTKSLWYPEAKIETYADKSYE